MSIRSLLQRRRPDLGPELAYVLASEAEEEEEPRRHGSVPGRSSVPRDRNSGYERLLQDYFVDRPVYDDHFFRRRFRMSKAMFMHICNEVTADNTYFQRRMNAAGTPGFHPLQKVTAAVRMLAYGTLADRLDDDIRMGESTVLDTVKEFMCTVVKIYGEKYLREPNEQDIRKLLHVAEQRGFPGMLGSIDCMHWEWERRPIGLHGQYRGHFKKPSIILEAVTRYDLWIWHSFFGMPGSCNDINVLHRSHVFDRLASGRGPRVEYVVNGRLYKMGYYLADGIYPPWATLISGISSPQSNKQRHFNTKQSAYRKDVERAFGVLQAKYAIIKNPARLWSPDDMKFIVDCVIILHNMGIAYESDIEQLDVEDYEDASAPNLDSNRNVPEIRELIDRHRVIQSRHGNEQLKADLVEHVWTKFGSQ